MMLTMISALLVLGAHCQTLTKTTLSRDNACASPFGVNLWNHEVLFTNGSCSPVACAELSPGLGVYSETFCGAEADVVATLKSVGGSGVALYSTAGCTNAQFLYGVSRTLTNECDATAQGSSFNVCSAATGVSGTVYSGRPNCTSGGATPGSAPPEPPLSGSFSVLTLLIFPTVQLAASDSCLAYSASPGYSSARLWCSGSAQPTVGPGGPTSAPTTRAPTAVPTAAPTAGVLALSPTLLAVLLAAIIATLTWGH